MAGKRNKFIFERVTGIEQPCVKDCPGRKAGCAVGCEKWADYLEKRQKIYDERLRQNYASCETAHKKNAVSKHEYRKKTYGWK